MIIKTGNWFLETGEWSTITTPTYFLLIPFVLYLGFMGFIFGRNIKKKQYRKILKQAIKQGGTTLKDFKSSDGNPGYLQQKLKVYNRKNESCGKGKKPIKQITLGQRSTFYCPNCQK